MNKKIILIAAAISMLAANTAIASDSDRHGRRGGDNRYEDNGYNSRGHSSRSNHQSNNWQEPNRNSRYTSERHNGYNYNGNWNYGPPPRAYYDDRNFSLGYHQWQRGDRLGYYQNRYPRVDYRHHHLRPPPRGYYWVQDNRGDFILAAIATGIILEVILGNRY